ncbi:MAG: hypothetical protein PHP42_00715 [Bacteroidota bacterium]|nr:hypothetical protein [Bacteroidota bacterium]
MATIRRIILFIFIASTALIAQQFTAEKILQNVKMNFDRVQDYSAQLTAKVDMERLRVPEMKVKIYFKQPNKFKTESKNTSFLPRNIFDLNPGDLLTKFDAILMGKENDSEKVYYKIRLISKPEKGKPPHESFIWIDAQRWTIDRFEAYPQEGRKIQVLIDQTLIDGKYFLPVKIFASFDFDQNTDSLSERIYNQSRMPRKGSVELRYSDYQVNTGLSDEIFEKKEKRESEKK